MATTAIPSVAGAATTVAPPKLLISGHWKDDTVGGTTKVHLWSVGDIVEVQPRTWAGINKPGGHGKISKIHYTEDGEIAGLDVKYTLSSCIDKELDPDLVKPYQELERRTRRRPAPKEAEEVQEEAPQKTLASKSLSKSNKLPSNSFDKENQQQAEAGSSKQPRRRPGAILSRRPIKKNGTTEQKKKVTRINDKSNTVGRRIQRISTSKRANVEGLDDFSDSSSFDNEIPREVCFFHDSDDDEFTCMSELLDPEQEILKQRRKFSMKPPTVDVSSRELDAEERGPPLELPSSVRSRRSFLSNFLSPRGGDKKSRMGSTLVSADAERERPPSARSMSIGSGAIGTVSPPPFALSESRGDLKSPASAAKSLGVGNFHKASKCSKRKAEPDLAPSHEHGRSSPIRRRAIEAAAALQHRSDLERVFLHDKKDANDFVEEVVANHKINGSNKSSPHLDDTSVTSLSFVGNASAIKVSDKRRNMFVSLFNDLLYSNDGAMEEDEILSEVNQRLQGRKQGNNEDAVPCYDAVDMEGYLQFLCKQDKIMRSDGFIYTI